VTFINSFKNFRYVYSESAKRDLKSLEKKIVLKIDSKLKDLVDGKPGLDIKKLVARNIFPVYRLRAGNYRVIFEVKKNELLIIIINAGHRKSIYKRKMK